MGGAGNKCAIADARRVKCLPALKSLYGGPLMATRHTIMARRSLGISALSNADALGAPIPFSFVTTIRLKMPVCNAYFDTIVRY